MTIQSGALPDKSYFTIGEAAAMVGVAPHVLRYWEKEFTQLKPLKRAGNRRFYRQRDVTLLREIRHLLHERRFTVEGAREFLRRKAHLEPAELLQEIRQELLELHRLLTGAPRPESASPLLPDAADSMALPGEGEGGLQDGEEDEDEPDLDDLDLSVDASPGAT
ncbi:MAG: MerR family transcriptional regulator [Magnetococcales bacterium]|nr:MerR family transcriptional regulator [Magnetococcales bacterium]